jgi:hypothetical protein
MLVSFFKTPRHKRFEYKPLYAKEQQEFVLKPGGNGVSMPKRIRFKRNILVQAGSARSYSGLRFVGLLAAILGLSGSLFGDAGWRQISYALLLFAGWVGWRLWLNVKRASNQSDKSNTGNERN